MACASSLQSGPYHRPFVTEKKSIKQLTFPQMAPTDNDQGISELNSTDSDDVKALKDKKQEIRGDQQGPARSPPMVKLVNLEFSIRRD